MPDPSVYRPDPQSRHKFGSFESQIGHELKQAVQLRVPESCTKPNRHINESQLPGPFISHLRQLLAQGKQ